MQNPVVVFTFFSFLFGKTFFVPNAEFSGGVQFFCFKLEALFLFKFGSKIQHCLFKWKFGSQTNLIMQNSMTVFTFPDLHWKDQFQANLEKKKSKLSVSYQDYLEHGEFNGALHFFYFRRETPFLVILHKKSQNCYFQLKFATYINANFSNSMVVLAFSTLDGKHPFYANLVGNIKIFSLS